MSRLAGKVAVITGGHSGMGLATARVFVAEGATVIITGRRQEALDAAVKDIGGTIEAVQGDIANLADLERLRDHIAQKHGRVDVLFANAGMAILQPFGQVTEEAFDKNVGVNFKGTFFTAQTLLPLMPDGSSIILNASIAATKGFPAFSVYSAAKAAVRSLARTMTTDLKDRRIRVNTISPGTVMTPALEEAVGKPNLDAFVEFQNGATPLGRLGKLEEIAKSVLYLASDDSGYVTGANLVVDGGVSAV